MKKIVLLILTLGLIFSCNSDPKKMELDYKTFEVKDFPTVKTNVVFIQGEGEQNEKMNKVIIDSTMASIFPDKPVESIQESLDEFVNNYKAFKKDFPDTEQVWELSVETEVVFKSETVITYSINTYSYTGGAHGNDRIILINFDPTTGSVFNNDDLILNRAKFLEVAEKAFIESQKVRNPDSKMEDYFFGEDFKLPENMGFSDDGFIMLYNVYEIASYAQGYTEYAIPFEDLDGILKVSPY